MIPAWTLVPVFVAGVVAGVAPKAAATYIQWFAGAYLVVGVAAILAVALVGGWRP